MSAPAAPVAPFLSEIIRNALTNVADEAGIVTARSAYSPLVSQSSQTAGALFDADLRLIAQNEIGLMHCSAIVRMLPEVLRDIPAETLRPGDVLIANDPFRGGIHPTDVGIFKPLFHDGELRFYYGALMVVSDLGGLSNGGLPANATEVFHEGLLIPPLKLYAEGEPNDDLHRMIAANSRTPKRVLGDIRALVVGANWAERRMSELCHKHGLVPVQAAIDELLDTSERLVRQAIERIPDGTYHGSYTSDDDGIDPDRTFTVRVAVTVEGSDVTLDFTGTDAQARGPINSTFSQSMAGIICELEFFFDELVPINDGLYRSIQVVLPAGSLVNPTYPAAANCRGAIVLAIMDSMNQALSGVCPDRVMAPSSSSHVFTLTGATDEGIWSLLDPHYGSVGARGDRDGIDCLGPFILAAPGYVRNVETYEVQYPLIYDRWSFWPDSGGPGKWRGGAGAVKQITFLSDADLTVRALGRCEIPPPGLAGGRAGVGGGWVLRRRDGTEERLPQKRTNIRVHEGETLIEYVSGGGGFGDPLERDPQLVARDVRKGVVTPAGAMRDYGVVLDDHRVVDLEGTRRLRASMASEAAS
jgi:N-methylhydantoinase B